MKWEYKNLTVRRKHLLNPDDFPTTDDEGNVSAESIIGMADLGMWSASDEQHELWQDLKELGDNSWEMVGVGAIPSGGNVLWFKRPKEEEPDNKPAQFEQDTPY